MDLIKAAITRPIAVIAAVVMAVLFGYVALQNIPIQLAPDVERPIITVETDWRGAAPAEIEREIINEQEDVFKGLEGLEKITSTSEDGRGRITLEFGIDTDMDNALLLVANRLDRVGGYPEEADEPTLSTAGSDDNAIAWFVIRRVEGNERPVHTYGDFAEDVIQDRLQRARGVARVDIFGGAERELQVVVDPANLARYGFTVPDVLASLRQAGISMSAGKHDENKRSYNVRTEGEFTSVEQVKSVILRTLQDDQTGRVARVLVGDVADVRFDYKEATSTIRVLGESALVSRAIRETGANVIETMKGIREAVDELNEVYLPEAGLTITQVYDETTYIDSAIDLVIQNIYIGGTLAAVILLLFLRSPAATLIISIAIPVSVIASFVAMAALGRSINVVSLAGIAFAVGMVVDAAIVVLENIFRLRQEGKSRFEAAYEGARQVWGAILVSALTTVMVFIPILVMKLEVGQLFRDIAVAISVAVLLSLVVAVTLIPSLSSRILGKDGAARIKPIKIPLVDQLAGLIAATVMKFTQLVVRSKLAAFVVVCLVTAGAGGFAYSYLPKLEYLPEGNRNLVFGFIIPPPGYNLDTMTGIAKKVEEATRPMWATETGAESAPGEPPKIDRFFFAAFRGNVIMGATAVDSQRAGELIGPMSRPIFSEPGTFGFLRQASIFGRGVGGARSIDFDISGPDLEQILGVALRGAGKIAQVLPREEGHQFRPDPGLELGSPEVRLFPDRVRLADAGVSARAFAQSVDAFNDGIRVDEITVGGERIDLTLKGPDDLRSNTQDIGNLPIVTRDGRILPVSALARVEVTAGPTKIRHLERERTVTLRVSPAAGMPLEEALEIIETEVIAPLRAEGLPPGTQIRLSGTADKLSQTFDAMKLQLLLALVIVYLVMAVLFESFIYPLIILVSVPLAAAGGVLGFWLVKWNLSPAMQFDMLTLLGFVILIGIVVNNAILIVHQTLLLQREHGLEANAAIIEATRNRLRPIFMSTLTSVFGMLPLVLFPGAGSELYQGLGSVVVGGLSLSAILTLLLIPPMLSLTAIWQSNRAKRADADIVAQPAE